MRAGWASIVHQTLASFVRPNLWHCSSQKYLWSCHSESITILPNLSTLKPTDTFATRIMPPKTFNTYYLCNAFYKKIATQIKVLLLSSKFTAKAPTARQGLQFLQSSQADGFYFQILWSMLCYTMPHLGALGFNPQTLINGLVLMDGDNVCDFMSKVL